MFQCLKSSRRRFLAGLLGFAAAMQGGWAPLIGAAQAGTAGANKGERLEPLFTSREDARRIIDTYCGPTSRTPLTEEQTELLISRLKPQFWLAADKGEGRIGQTRFGGAPDMREGASWPMRVARPDLAKSEAEGRSPKPWIVRQLGEAVPYEFVAQIDLAEAARHPDLAKGLPQTGRLLFFIDDALLMHEPWGNQTACPCHVVFDEAVVGDLARLPVPARFEEMEAWWRTPDPEEIARVEKIARDLEAAGQKEAAAAMREVAKASASPDPDKRKPFVYPARAMKLVPILALPNESAIEVGMDADLERLVDDDVAGEHYQRLTANDVGPFTTDPDDMRVSQPWLMREARRNRLLGPPQPEQGDPRFDAIPRQQRPPYPWNDEQISAMNGKADEWLMLLQVSMADLSRQSLREGTLYFMVHKDDLARRDFTRAVVTYQQT